MEPNGSTPCTRKSVKWYITNCAIFHLLAFPGGSIWRKASVIGVSRIMVISADEVSVTLQRRCSRHGSLNDHSDICRPKERQGSVTYSYHLSVSGTCVFTLCFYALGILHIVKTCSGTHAASYPVGTGGSFPGGKATGVWSFALTSI
jgi:hypothetical protein